MIAWWRRGEMSLLESGFLEVISGDCILIYQRLWKVTYWLIPLWVFWRVALARFLMESHILFIKRAFKVYIILRSGNWMTSRIFTELDICDSPCFLDKLWNFPFMHFILSIFN